MAKKASKSKKKQQKATTPKTTKPTTPKQPTTQASVKQEAPQTSALVPITAERSIPTLPTYIVGKNVRKPDEVVVMDVHTRLAVAAMPIPIEPTPRTKIAVTVANELTKLYSELDKAGLPQGVVEVFQAHIACAIEQVGLACLF